MDGRDSTTITRDISALRAGLSSWLSAWTGFGQLIGDLVLAAPYLLVVVLICVGLVLLPLLLVGLPFLLLAIVTAAGLARLERSRIEVFTGVYIPRPVGPVPAWPWRRAMVDPRVWRAVLYLAGISFWGVVAGTFACLLTSISLAAVALPLYARALPGGRLNLPGDAAISGLGPLVFTFASGALLLVALPFLVQRLTVIDVALACRLLGPGSDEQVERLVERIETLTQTREATVDSVEAERQRIERDLHDGPQQRLVSIAMELGMARDRLSHDPSGASELLDTAHASTMEAITEMRQVARGIHPPVLTARGLDAALSALAARAPVPVTIQVDLARRPSPTVEAIAYFCVSEALTNVAKHAQASAAEVEVRIERSPDPMAGELIVVVRDDGIGGADPSLGGTGWNGLTHRVRAVDGRLRLDSPPGGPTVLTVALPMLARSASGGLS